MEFQDTTGRWQQVFTMINQMLLGNFSHHIPRSSHNDELEQLIVKLNTLSQHLEAVFKRIAFINPRKSFLFLAKLVLVLNKRFRILNTGKVIPKLLNRPAKDLIGEEFKVVLHPSSRENWDLVERSLPTSKFSQINLRLFLKTKNGLYLAGECAVSKLINERHAAYTVSFYEAAVFEGNSEKLRPEMWMTVVNKQDESHNQDISETMVPSDYQKVQHLRDHILKNIKGPKPDFKELADGYGMSEKRLRAIFKHVFMCTPLQYYYKERSQNILELVQTSEMSLKEISVRYNYEDYAHFSNNFKKEFGVSPMNMRLTLKKNGGHK